MSTAYGHECKADIDDKCDLNKQKFLWRYRVHMPRWRNAVDTSYHNGDNSIVHYIRQLQLQRGTQEKK